MACYRCLCRALEKTVAGAMVVRDGKEWGLDVTKKSGGHVRELGVRWPVEVLQ
jgi:hypothetical protein